MKAAGSICSVNKHCFLCINMQILWQCKFKIYAVLTKNEVASRDVNGKPGVSARL